MLSDRSAAMQAQLPEVRLVGPTAARLDFALYLARLTLVNGGVGLVTLDLPESPLGVHLADAGGAPHLGRLAPAFVKSLAGLKVAAVDDHVDGVAMGLVGLAVFVVDGEHHLLVRVVVRRVLLGVAQASPRE